jgi:AcrR family transcriptional regulator
MAEALPDFRRATRQDALDLARSMFLACERVDMQVLAERLGVARGTIYRWVKSREDLLDELFGDIVREMYGVVREQPGGVGLDRVVAATRTAMEVFAAFEPARTFVQREPQLAVRLLMGETGGVHRELMAGTREMLVDEGATPGPELDDLVDVVMHIATSLIWVTFAIGEEPQIDRAAKVVRQLFATVLGDAA